MMISDNWDELMLPGLRTIFNKHLKKKKDYVGELYTVEKSTKQAEYNQGTGSLGMMDEWGASNNQVSYEDVNKGYKATYMHKKYSKGLTLERELVEDDQYGEIKKRVRLLTQTVYYTRQYYGAQLFNEAFNATFSGPDGVALCSASHPNSPVDATTQSNAGTGVLNATNLEVARTAMKGWKDDKGNLLAIEPNTLIVPPSLRKAALVIADSSGEPDVSDNNVNVWKGSVNVIEFDFLTSSTAWFVADKERMAAFLHWYDRRIAKLEMDRENFNSEVGAYKVVSRFSKGADEWSFLYGSTGTVA
ncbi:MAG: Mu-like prophage major head subunit gpT family protein [Bacteroidales bacterium]|nr:Mu-like prophage major head subunit gpT family protein [Bacteroidales bacterium]